MASHKYFNALDDLLWRLGSVFGHHYSLKWPDAVTYSALTSDERAYFIDNISESMAHESSDRMCSLEQAVDELQQEAEEMRRQLKRSNEADTEWCVVDSKTT